MASRETEKAHVKMLLEAAMNQTTAKHNPPLEKAVGTLSAVHSSVEESVEEAGGWQAGLLRAHLNGRDYAGIADDLDDYTADQIQLLDDMMLASLDKGIQPELVFEALDEFVDETHDEVEAEHGVDFRELEGPDDA